MNINSFSNFSQINFKHPFSESEDRRLRMLVSIYGDKEWKLVADKMPNRSSRQCRERYKNYLAPDIINGPWTPEEDELLKEKYQIYGSKWSKIQSFFTSRSDINIKNRWTITSGRKSKENRIKAFIINSKTTENENLLKSNESFQFDNKQKSPLLSPNSPSLLNQESSSPDSNTRIEKIIDNQNLPHFSFNDILLEKPRDSIDSGQISGLNSKLPQYKIRQNAIQKENANDDQNNNSVKKQLFPPISSFSDSKIQIVEKLFNPSETKIDELIIFNGQNLSLANNFPHFGGNLW